MKASLYIASGEGLWLPAWTMMTGIFHLCLTVAQRNCGINLPPHVYYEMVLVQSQLYATPNTRAIALNCVIMIFLFILESIGISNLQPYFDSESRTEKEWLHKHCSIHDGLIPSQPSKAWLTHKDRKMKHR